MDALLRPAGRLVLVDDDAALLNALRFAFEADGYEVTALANGQALLDAPPDEPSGCIVIDERLPDISGLDVIGKLRRLGVKTPAILITSHPSGALRKRAAAARVAIVEKPLMGDALILKVREALAS